MAGYRLVGGDLGGRRPIVHGADSTSIVTCGGTGDSGRAGWAVLHADNETGHEGC